MNAPVIPQQIEYWPLARLKPNARNAKTHDPHHVAKIAASMAEFGWSATEGNSLTQMSCTTTFTTLLTRSIVALADARSKQKLLLR